MKMWLWLAQHLVFISLTNARDGWLSPQAIAGVLQFLAAGASALFAWLLYLATNKQIKISSDALAAQIEPTVRIRDGGLPNNPTISFSNIGSVPVVNLHWITRSYLAFKDGERFPILSDGAWTQDEYPDTILPGGQGKPLALQGTLRALDKNKGTNSVNDQKPYYIVVTAKYQRGTDLREFSQRVRYIVYWIDSGPFIVRDDFSNCTTTP